MVWNCVCGLVTNGTGCTAACPEDGQLMSPSVVYEHPYTMLQVPVKEVVQDASGLKERIAAERNVCGVQFGTKDVFAVASVLTADGKEAAVRYFKG